MRCSLHTIHWYVTGMFKQWFKVHNSMVFIILMGLCNHCHNLILEHLHHLKGKTSCPFTVNSITKPSPRQPIIYFLPLYSCLSKKNHWKRNLCSCLASFNEHNVFERHPFCGNFGNRIVFHCSAILHFQRSIHRLIDIWVVFSFWLF